MPHVVFVGKFDIEYFYNNFLPFIRKESTLVKITDVYMNKSKKMLLISALVIDKVHQEFMIEIDVKEGQSTLRLYPMTYPEEKTNGVKYALGYVAQQILYHSPDLKILRTNIEDFIPTNTHSSIFQ